MLHDELYIFTKIRNSQKYIGHNMCNKCMKYTKHQIEKFEA
jgi:hypothetical protein